MTIAHSDVGGWGMVRHARPTAGGGHHTAALLLFIFTFILLISGHPLPMQGQQRGERGTQRGSARSGRQDKPRPSTSPTARGPAQSTSIAVSAPRGIYVTCGLLVASPVHPVGDTVGYRVERRESRGQWMKIADVSAAASLTDLRARIGTQPIDDAVRRMKLQNPEEFWKTLVTRGNLENILITPDRGVLEALGLLYLDTTAIRETSYTYRVSHLLSSGSTASARESGSVVYGASWPMPPMTVLQSEETDSSVRISWAAPLPRPVPVRASAYRRMSGQEEYRLLPRPVSMWMGHDTVYCAIHDMGLRPSQQYEYFIVPEDFFGNIGPSSQTSVIHTVNFSRLPLPENLRAEQDTFGIRLRWTTDITEHLIATRIYRSTQYDTGYALVGEVPATEATWLDASAIGMSRYFYRLSSVSYDNRESQRTGSVFGFGRSPIPPATPQAFTASAVEGGTVLHWSRNAERDIAGYYVLRAESDRDSLVVVSSLLPDTSYIDTSRNLRGSIQYRYAVIAVNHSQLRSGLSNIEILRPGVKTDPAPPRTLSARATDAGIALNWNDPRAYDESVLGYVLYRAEVTAGGGVVFSPIARRVGMPERTSWYDTTVVPGRRYLYAVASLDVHGGEGKRTSAVEAGIRIILPPPPPDLRASAIDGAVRLEWAEPDSPDLAEITVYRAERGQEPKKLTSIKPGLRTYLDTSARHGTMYYYTLSCTNLRRVEGPRTDPVRAMLHNE